MTEALQRVSTASDGLALEAGLFADADPRAALWQAAMPALVCPAAYRRRPGFDRAAELSAARGWPVVARPTGGGTVPQGAGILNLALSTGAGRGFTLEDGYRLVTGPIISVVARLGLRLEAGATRDSFCDGDWNLSSGGRKLVGTAQRWRVLRDNRFRILAHALILVRGPVAAQAVSAFHSDLGFAPVREEAHTTLEAELHNATPPIERLARALLEAASQALTKAPDP